MVVRKAVWDEKGERQLKRGLRSEVKKYFPSDQVETDEGLGQVCADCGHDIPLSDVTGQYKGKCAKCREKQRARDIVKNERRSVVRQQYTGETTTGQDGVAEARKEERTKFNKAADEVRKSEWYRKRFG